MATGSDLFLADDSKTGKARKSFSEIISEDSQDAAVLAAASQEMPDVAKLTKAQSFIAAALQRPKSITAATMAILLAGVGGLFIHSSYNEIGIQTTLPVVQRTAISDPKPVLPLAEVRATEDEKEPVVTAKDDLAETQLLKIAADTKLLASRSIDTIIASKLGKEVAISEKLDDDRVVVPITEFETVKTMDVNAITAEAEDQNHDIPTAASNIPKDDSQVSASDLIDQIGFGSMPHDVENPTAAESGETSSFDGTTPADEVGNITVLLPETIPVPQARPAVEGETTGPLTYRIIDREGEKAGFRRMRENDPSSTQWFLVVEALDQSGKPVSMHVMDMDDEEIKKVEKWAIQVSEADFRKYSEQKRLTGKIADTVVGTAQNNETAPTWSVAATGGMITKWN